MKKQLPVLLLAITSIVLAVLLYQEKQNSARLERAVATVQEAAVMQQPEPVAEIDTIPAPSAETGTVATLQPPPVESTDPQQSSQRRMMEGMAEIMKNPTINKMMESSQRGAMHALYEDLMDYLKLSPEESDYFMDLIMHRQMAAINLVMAGNVSQEERERLQAELDAAAKNVEEQMEHFLNNEEDYAEFQYYEKTMGERMMLSQMDQYLAGSDNMLSDQTYRELLGVMHETKSSFAFTTDLQDEKNMDLSPERFSSDNVKRYSDDLTRLNAQMIERAAGLLTPEQLKAFESAIEAFTKAQTAQLEMTSQMFNRGN